MSKVELIFKETSKVLPKGSFSCQAPSNIALIKYWGKYGIQLPKNPSLSFTLSQCSTKTKLSYVPKPDQSKDFEFEIIFEGQKTPDFKPKIQTFFERIVDYVPFIRDYAFEIDTSNTFPHSSGIASSASGMAALAHGIMQMERALNPDLTTDYFNKKTSFLARLGSGSAARSTQGPIMIWGENSAIEGSTNEYAILPPFSIHPNFSNYQDSILIVDKGQKQVSSTVGHNLMQNHPFAENRFEQANANLLKMTEILKSGNLDGFVNLVESEALTLHAMMLTSQPYYILMKPNTLHIIEEVWNYRKETGSHLCFTLDAGANAHLLYPEKEKGKVLTFIKNQLSQYCENGKFIEDCTGTGIITL